MKTSAKYYCFHLPLKMPDRRNAWKAVLTHPLYRERFQSRITAEDAAGSISSDLGFRIEVCEGMDLYI